MVKLRIKQTKEDLISNIKEMIIDYNTHLNRFDSRTDDDFEKDAKMMTRLVSNNRINNYLDFILRPVSHGKYVKKGVLISLDSVLKYESSIMEEYCLKLIQNPKFQKNIESRISRIKIGTIHLKEMREEENAFYYLLDRKITQRILNKTIYYCDLPSRSESYENFRQIKQALEDVENEFKATNIGIFQRLEITEQERLKSLYIELERREAVSLEKLRQLKIQMYSTPTEVKKDKSINDIAYKQCNDCGAWHNAQYNRCAPCNDFSAKNDQ